MRSVIQFLLLLCLLNMQMLLIMFVHFNVKYAYCCWLLLFFGHLGAELVVHHLGNRLHICNQRNLALRKFSVSVSDRIIYDVRWRFQNLTVAYSERCLTGETKTYLFPLFSFSHFLSVYGHFHFVCFGHFSFLLN